MVPSHRGRLRINPDCRYISWLLDFLAEQGIDSDALAKRHGVDLETLAEARAVVSESQQRALLCDALSETGDTGLGLQLGIRRSPAVLGELGYFLMSCRTLRESTKLGLVYQDYMGHFSGRSVVTIFSEIEGQGFCYQVVPLIDDLGPLRLLVVEEILANIVATSQWVLGRPLPLTRLVCGYPRPPHGDRYDEIFRCPLQFDAPSTRLFIDAKVLDQPLPHASSRTAAFYARRCQLHCLERNRGDLAERAWGLIADHLSGPPNLAAAAAALHCSPRTLSRKLVVEGFKYHQLVDKVREVHARRALSDPTQSITRIAQELGYADASGFFRAFKKWTGQSPDTFRQSSRNRL